MDRKIVEQLMGGASVKRIASSLHVSKRRVRGLREQAKEHGYLNALGAKGSVSLPPYPEALFPEPADGRALRLSESHQKLHLHHDWIQERLGVGWHAVTVFEELPLAGITRSSFYRYLDRYQLNRVGECFRVVPEIRHQPGEALILDWGKLRVVLDPVTGRRKTLWMFVGVLGFSRYLMARLVWTMDVETTLMVLESMLREIAGVPTKITIDNPKCIALEASLYEPLLNPAAERFAAHYGLVIEALPPADPQKKGKVERQMPYVRRLYEAHGEAWLGLEESQHYLDRKVVLANDRRHGTTLRRPQELFAQEEAGRLKSLPATAYEMETFHEGLVRQDGHIRFHNKYYSTDEHYIGKTVAILGNVTRVAIYHQGRLIETHPRITDPTQSKSTKPQHLKPWERAMEDHSLYRSRAATLGPSAEALVMAIIKQGQGFIDTRKVWGILSLDKKYPAEHINEACRQALEVHSLSYRMVRRFLELRAVSEKSSGQRALLGARPRAGIPPSTHRFVRPLAVYEKACWSVPEAGPA